MLLKAMAKINLGLDVLRRREDGYHDVRMIMQSVYLYDQIEIQKSSEQGIYLQTNRDYLPVDDNNLIVKAAKLLMEEFNIKEGVKIRLTKNIPVAAGMAGGSTDAAATLIGLNKLFELKLTEKQLMERGAKLGADIPFCIMRGTALSEGIGDELTRLQPIPMCHIVIAKPGISVSTKYVYTNLHLEKLEHHPNIDGMLKAIEDNSLQGIVDCMENVLESVTVTDYPVISQLKEKMIEYGALNALMSGSGPTVFGIFDKKETAVAAAKKLREDRIAKQVVVTRPFQVTP